MSGWRSGACRAPLVGQRDRTPGVPGSAHDRGRIPQGQVRPNQTAPPPDVGIHAEGVYVIWMRLSLQQILACTSRAQSRAWGSLPGTQPATPAAADRTDGVDGVGALIMRVASATRRADTERGRDGGARTLPPVPAVG